MNIYLFDYRLVLAEDPHYGRFLDREVIEPESGPRVRRDELTYAVRNTEDTEVENDIIDFVHDGSAAPLNTLDAAEEDAYDADESFDIKPIEVVTLKKEYEDPPNPDFNPNTLALPPPNRFLLPGSKVWQGEDTLYKFTKSTGYHEQNFIYFIQKYRFSQAENKIRLQKTIYRFDKKRNFTSEMKKHFQMLIYNTETKQLYRLRKIKSSATKRARFCSKVTNVFNTLPHLSWNNDGTPKRLQDKFASAIIGAAVKDVPGLAILDIDETVYPVRRNPRGWSTERTPRISETVTRLVTIKEAETLRLAAVILQHRVGQPMPWINLLLLRNMWDIMSNTSYYDKVLSNGTMNRSKQTMAKSKNIRRRTIFKLIPNLRKSNHMKTAVKTLLGDYHNNFFLKLFNTTRLDIFLANWILCAHRDLIRKNIRHWLVQSIHSNDDVLLSMVMSVINPILEHLGYSTDETLKTVSQEVIVMDSYVKTCQRLMAGFKSNQNSHSVAKELPKWHTWRDLFNMANELGIRIRPNRLRDVAEIKKVHDKLSSIISRDIGILRKYENVIFDEFVSPDKEYGGFKFAQLRTAGELTHEGIVMHHCVASYASRCAEGKSIIFSMRKDDKSYITIELNPRTYGLVQQYTLHDITVTSQGVLDLIKEWQADCLELHKDEKESYHDKHSKRLKIETINAQIENLKNIIAEGMVENEGHILEQIRKYENELEDMTVETRLQEVMNA